MNPLIDHAPPIDTRAQRRANIIRAVLCFLGGTAFTAALVAVFAFVDYIDRRVPMHTPKVECAHERLCGQRAI